MTTSVSATVNAPHALPFQEMALPLLSTAIQKWGEGQETDWMELLPWVSSTVDADHDLPFQLAALWAPIAMQKWVEGHDTKPSPAYNTDALTFSGVDHETPFHVKYSPLA